MRKHIEQPNIIREYTKAEAVQLAEQWLAVFGKEKLGAGTKSYLWHVFSYERYPSISGTEAEAAYLNHAAPEYIVLSNERDYAIATSSRPEQGLLRDYLVFPPNLAWVMAFTHEDGWLGPYFAKHPQYEKLEAENTAKIRKAQEAKIAKSKGWC